jgi:hypothetical protein
MRDESEGELVLPENILDFLPRLETMDACDDPNVMAETLHLPRAVETVLLTGARDGVGYPGSENEDAQGN